MLFIHPTPSFVRCNLKIGMKGTTSWMLILSTWTWPWVAAMTLPSHSNPWCFYFTFHRLLPSFVIYASTDSCLNIIFFSHGQLVLLNNNISWTFFCFWKQEKGTPINQFNLGLPRFLNSVPLCWIDPILKWLIDKNAKM